MPDRAGRAEIQPFAPSHVGIPFAVDSNAEIIAEGKAEALEANVAVTFNVAGELGFRRPGSTAVGRTTIERIPQRRVARIHPGDANVIGIAGGNRREGVFNTGRGARNAFLGRPGIALGGGRREINSLRTLVG